MKKAKMKAASQKVWDRLVAELRAQLAGYGLTATNAQICTYVEVIWGAHGERLQSKQYRDGAFQMFINMLGLENE